MARLLCGVDLGGTKLSVGLVSQAGQVQDRLVTHDHTRKGEGELVLQIREPSRDMLCDPMEISLAKTGSDAGLIGAAALLLEEQ